MKYSTNSRSSVSDLQTSDHPPARALIYVRSATVSQKGPEADAQIREQYRACRVKARQLGAHVVAEYADIGASGNDSQRPGLSKLSERLFEEPRIGYLIVRDVSRLSRNMADHVAIAKQIKRANVQLVSCTETIDDSPSGRFLGAIAQTMAEFYSRAHGEAVKAGRKRAAERRLQSSKPRTGIRT